MKKTARVFSVALILLLVLGLAACNKKAAAEEEANTNLVTLNDLYGSWKGINGEISTVSFSKDGDYMDNAGDGLYVSGTYSFNEADQTVTVYEKEYGMVFVYSVTLSGNQLTLQMDGGLPRTFAK